MSRQQLVFLIFSILLTSIGHSQNTSDEIKSRIAAALENYFDLEREAIHIHLDKTSFINNESIWYQGYIINRKTNKPYFTTNVFVVLYDEYGTQISEKLQYASNGVFFGKIELNPKLKSGHYYIQVYTNWMNNFSENESTITKVNIINPLEGIKNYKKINKESLQISLNPEGKSYILGIANQVGIQVKDCRGNSPENLEAVLQNDKNEVLKTIKLNKFGFGKFEIIPTNENLKVSIEYEDKIIEKSLPKPDGVGYALNVNNFTIEGKSIIKISSNTTTNNLMSGKKIYLVVHQDQKYSLYDLPLNSSKSELTIPLNNTDLFEGINTIRIIDSDLKQWAERLIYSATKKETVLTVMQNKNGNDKINFVGYSSYQNSNLSISVLPESSKSWDNNNSIIAGITVNPYLTEPLERANYYLNNPERMQRYELDLLLLNQEKFKYDWTTIKMTAPKANYTFDIGITLKGTIEASIQNKTYHKIKLVSYKDFIMTGSNIDDKGEYNFEHILIADSTYVSLELQKLPNFDPIKTNLTPQVVGRRRPFNKPFTSKNLQNCVDPANDDFFTDLDMPKFSSKVIQLEEVKVAAKKKTLLYKNRIGNGNLRSYKIDETVHFRDILSFIEMNGFTVSRNRGDVQIYSRIRSSLNGGQATPLVYIDERKVLSLDELDLMSSDEVDEVYLDPHAIVASMNNNQGIIKIYRKTGVGKSKQKQDPNSFYIKDGFARYFGFENADYETTQSGGFDNYGLIHWLPQIMSDDSGQFLFDIPNYNKSTAKIIIEGMTGEGRLFHEEKIIDLE
ncbi:MAG: hypothetical protein V4535_10980 [Bacteroidota bacterium]